MSKEYQLIILRCDGIHEYTFHDHHPTYKEIGDMMTTHLPQPRRFYILHDWERGDMTQGVTVRVSWGDLPARIFSFKESAGELEFNEIGTELMRTFGGFEAQNRTICGPVAVLTMMP